MMMKQTIVAIAICAVGAACAATSSSPVKLGDAVTLSSPTAVGTAPMFAVSPSGKQAVAWVSAPDGGTDGRLYVSVAGAPPTEIRDSLGPVEAHGESPPKLAYAPNGELVAVYGGLQLHDRCNCVTLRANAAHRIGRSGVDAWLGLDFVNR